MSPYMKAYENMAIFFRGLNGVADAAKVSFEGPDKTLYMPVVGTRTEFSSAAGLTIPESLRAVEASIGAQFKINFSCSEAGDCRGNFFVAVADDAGYVLPTSDHVVGKVDPIFEWLTTIIGAERLFLCTSLLSDPSASPGEVYDTVTAPNLYTRRADENSPDKLILTAGPSISCKEIYYAQDAAASGWNSSWSKYLDRFEAEFAEYVGAKYALATSSCTGALHIALMALDIGPGDEVIVPDQTWVATANAVRYAGATPIFADVEFDTWNIDSSKLENLITNKTKAIMPVHMYGHPARMSEVMKIAEKYNLRVVEDAAPAIGAEWEGKRCGSFGDFAGFSFQGAKLLVTGEGGMLVTNDDALYERAKKIWDQGRNPNKTFWIDAEGVKYKMSNIQAAIGLGQLERADELIAMKRRIFDWYEEGLSGVEGVYLNKEVEGAKSIYWMSSIRLDEGLSIGRDELIKKLRERNVDSRPVFPAISQYPIWDRKQAPQPTASLIGRQALNLPSGVCRNRQEIAYVCRQLKELLA